jgi:DNA topoisomerase-1
VSTLLDPSRGYCEVVDGCIVPTDKGMALSDFLDKSFGDIININYTSEMEKDLDLIANSKLDYLLFLKNLYNKLEETAKKVSGGPRPKAEPSDRVCPECGKPLVFRTGAYGRFLGCTGYPKCKYTEKVGN